MNYLDVNCISYLNYAKVIANDHILPQMSLTGVKLRFINAKKNLFCKESAVMTT